ncbi:prephenate dehydrogenase [Halarchaeum sp. CBA1220]|uniref:prephenate dehydrogenase dimerization domain-containing protein n=1 Tax=Halarchaeum sp. CBA1220 TaxID=1853682 RepID=UPI000F3AA8EC|nr:NAD(P)-binding domain-containing protein [Halarchaeum sp. CBA1220]QLC34580.1 prephenate dehydrogenase [Halarchaeum sp. CBA1220]
MEVLVVGAGEMGRWFAAAVASDVAFADADPARAEAAADALDRRARAVPLDSSESFGVVCVAVPMRVATEAVAEHAGKAEQAVVDVTGSMRAPLDAMARVAPARERVSFHPLFAADAAPGTVAVSTAAGGPATDGVRRDLEAAGNDLVDVAPEEHDDAMRTVQGRTHAAILAFALAADAAETEVPDALATPVYDQLAALAARVLDGTPRVYADIQATFDGARDIAAAAERLAETDPEDYDDLFEDVRG